MKLIKKNKEDQEKFHLKDLMPLAKLQAKISEFFKKAKKTRKKKKENRTERQWENNIPATGNNTKKPVAKKCKEDKNVICYKCYKKKHYANKYSELKKPKNK